jgi:hypothetical protein
MLVLPPDDRLISCKRSVITYGPLSALGGRTQARQRAARTRRLH